MIPGDGCRLSGRIIDEPDVDSLVDLDGAIFVVYVHFSAAIELLCPRDPQFKVLSIIASPFFWPFPHRAAVDYDNISYNGYTYTIDDKTGEYRKENFVRLDIEANQLVFEVFPREVGAGPVISQTFTL